ncbi:uncharacterized protein VTP21DRAFT_2912 [Calcarisporiella thermophila]|uniref:uncharacterized protein n=1 Tax=Calcarisporiella thermophila TaxID=911321 RepID=UPI00374453D3
MNLRTLIVAALLAATSVQAFPFIRRDECSLESCHGMTELLRKCVPKAADNKDDGKFYEEIFKCYCNDSTFLDSYGECIDACGKYAKNAPSVNQMEKWCKLI